MKNFNEFENEILTNLRILADQPGDFSPTLIEKHLKIHFQEPKCSFTQDKNTKKIYQCTSKSKLNKNFNIEINYKSNLKKSSIIDGYLTIQLPIGNCFNQSKAEIIFGRPFKIIHSIIYEPSPANINDPLPADYEIEYSNFGTKSHLIQIHKEKGCFKKISFFY